MWGKIMSMEPVRRDDPSKTSFIAVSRKDRAHNSMRSEAVEAIRGNPHSKSICASFGKLARTVDIDPLIHDIENRSDLEEVLWKDCLHLPGTVLCDRLLEVVLRNEAIQTLDLASVRFSSGALASLLASTRSILKLSITSCEIVALGTTPERIASAFQKNSSIRDLRLCEINEHFIQLALSGLRVSSNSRLENLELTLQDPSTRTCNALQELMASSTMSTFRSLRLRDCSFGRDSFEALFKGIRNSSSATSICFSSCSFDYEATLLLESAFQTSANNGRLHNLEIEGGCAVQFAKPPCTVLVNVLGPASTLKALKLTGFCFFDWHAITVKEIATIMQAIASSPSLESLCLQSVNTAATLQAIADGLVQSQWLKKFRFSVMDKVKMDAAARRRLLEAFRRNTSLEEISYAGGDRQEFFDQNELAKLERSSSRNKALPLLMKTSDEIPLLLWPSIWNNVQACHLGQDFIFRSLLNISSSLG